MKTHRGFISILTLTFAAAFSASSQSLTSLDGRTVNVSSQNGKVVVLAIGASWLPLSSRQAEFTNALAKKYAGRDVAVYFVVTDSVNAGSKNFASIDGIRKFSAENKINVSVFRDPDGAATLRKFNVEQVPSFVILDKTGRQVGEPIGGIDPTGKYDITIPISKAIDKLL